MQTRSNGDIHDAFYSSISITLHTVFNKPVEWFGSWWGSAQSNRQKGLDVSIGKSQLPSGTGKGSVFPHHRDLFLQVFLLSPYKKHNRWQLSVQSGWREAKWIQKWWQRKDMDTGTSCSCKLSSQQKQNENCLRIFKKTWENQCVTTASSLLKLSGPSTTKEDRELIKMGN